MSEIPWSDDWDDDELGEPNFRIDHRGRYYIGDRCIDPEIPSQLRTIRKSHGIFGHALVIYERCDIDASGELLRRVEDPARREVWWEPWSWSIERPWEQEATA